MTGTSLSDCSLLPLPRIRDGRGSLSFVEAAHHVPFRIARLFYMYDFPMGTRRGGHAHRECAQFLIALEGAFDVTLHDGRHESTVPLSSPDQGLHIPPGIWVTVQSRTDRAVIIALASAGYDEGDYLRDFDGFLHWKQVEPPLPSLSDGRILLRPYVADDARAFSASARGSVETVGKWLSWCTPAFDEERAARYIRTSTADRAGRTAFSYGIFDAADGAHLGGIALNRIDWPTRCANLGYWVASHAAGRGVCTAAARLMIRHGFMDLGLQRIEIMAAVANEPSRRVALRVGARPEGILRGKVARDGVPEDAELFALLRGDAPVEADRRP